MFVGHTTKEASAKLKDHTEASVLMFTRSVEEKMRCKALEWVRVETHVPWGTALIRATTEHAHIWQDEAHLLVKRRGQEQPRSAPPPVQGSPTPKGAKGKGRGKGESGDLPYPPKKFWATIRVTKEGGTICKMYNDDRGCKQWCPYKHEHCCDIKLRGGRACGATSHTRRTHDPKSHGAPSDYRNN